MMSAIKLIALSLPPESTIGLVPLVASLSAVLASVVGVFFYGLVRVKKSEGLAPGRVEQPYDGPALTWTPSAEPTRKLVTHDALGLGSDLAWLKNRGDVPASLARETYTSEPIIALEFAAKVHSTNLSIAAEIQSRHRRFSAEASAAEKLAALKAPAPAPQPRPAAPTGVRLRTAVLRAADPAPAATVTHGPVVEQAVAEKAAVVAPSKPVAAPATTQTRAPKIAVVAPAIAKISAPSKPAPVRRSAAGPSLAPAVAHIAPLAAALAAAKPAPASSPAIEGKVTEYSFADFLPALPEPALSKSAGGTRK